ncbi:DUF3817 domain-containing protein [Corynebacterium sphenisci]|uniref:DUF3817 domain-containing protein n=1 Tax=Corynebacterium sphenisci TaxID=191493 RepID=UPI0026DEDEAD|nr:DUF3817 domain-containing protein [Corynebacterium sphenisci]MDO5730272.1 DUF3817 domain-containing protein [Corynebacterium sphenisci]
MTETRQDPDRPAAPVSPDRARRVKVALTLFSITAYVTGIMLLTLVAAMVAVYGFMDYGFADGRPKPGWFTPIAVVHGYCYMAFLIAVVNLGTKARWAPSKWIVTALGGVVPLLSFFVEKRRREEVVARFGL